MSRDFVIDVINFVEMKVLDNNDDTYTAYTVSVQVYMALITVAVAGNFLCRH